MLFSLQILTRNIIKQKVSLSISRDKGMLNKHLNACFYEHSNIEEREE